MGLLSEIQVGLMTDGSRLGPILLKLRFLASRLGSDVLAEWVRFETEGYPKGIDVPSYRTTGVHFTGSFGNIVQQMKNVPIPSYLMAKFAGASWNAYDIREALGVIDSMIDNQNKVKSYGINTSNLPLLLQGKIYEGLNCISVYGHIDINALINVREAVRSKGLDLTLEIQKNVAGASKIEIAGDAAPILPGDGEKVSQMTQQIINYGSLVMNSGNAGDISSGVTQGNIESLISDLAAHGMPPAEARELADIMKMETPESPEKPFGRRAWGWVSEKVGKATGAVWGMGKAAATTTLAEAAKKYYGIP